MATPRPRPARHYQVLPELFTDEMRDRQARGGDPHSTENESTEDDKTLKAGEGSRSEPFNEKEKRGMAMAVLDDPDRLLMYAQSTGETVPSQRMRFMKVLCGFDKSDDETDDEPPPVQSRRQGDNAR